MTWALEWRSNSPLGRSQYIIRSNGVPALFRTRQSARNYADREYGYIKTRDDLRLPPHCWRMPRPVRVRVVRE